MSIAADLIRGHTETIILSQLLKHDSYGYEINKTIRTLSGGRYDKLMERMGKSASAIGFAICPEQMPIEQGDGFDFDMLLLYSASDSPAIVVKAVNEVRKKGMTVRAEADGNDYSALSYRYLSRIADVLKGDAE